jgi:serine/threonine-protein kinase RsbW
VRASPAAAALQPAKGAAGGRPKMKQSFTIPSDYVAGRDVQHRIMQDVETAGFDADNIFAIRIALEEALVNAIKHGNRQDPTKLVKIEADVRPGVAEIMIEDEGPGFERHKVPDPTARENLSRPSGRGILLIEAYMSEVRWEEGGRRVWMLRRNEPIDLGQQ